MAWAIERLGGVEGRRVLELGPLEGGHSYMLDRAGAKEVLAIEGNRRAFLRCLVARDIVGMPAVRFVHGDFVPYLRDARDHWDVIVASGVLYHMTDPMELLVGAARACSALFLWTHYVDEAVTLRGFCGGPRRHAYWLTRSTILTALARFGFTSIETAHEEPHHQNGPAFSVLARK